MTIEERFSLALHHAARAWRLVLDRRLKDLGVGQAGWLSIGVIAKSRQALSQSELADRVGVEAATMVPMIDRLVKSGLVQRVPSELDRRIKLVLLTPAGWDVYGKVKAEADVCRQAFLADVDPLQLRMATELLESLLAAAESALDPGSTK